MHKEQVYVPNSRDLRRYVLKEMHDVPYVGHHGHQKTLVVIRIDYFWPGLKKDLAVYIAQCMECQRVKVEHRHPIGLLQPFPIPEWKWEVVNIDFITKPPMTTKKHDSIMVVVDKLTKSTHLVLVKSTHKKANIEEIYM